ncbi:ribonuclease E activity regulator RraA [Bacillus sp. DTU_2020_1000418_1_SI_GHA_SEK_038]|uniref:ribonuclease E activity regulator RraA n=1 Tax=Bacillus sp. DTU_2020_1000418_1_SI_GHA_SEK_038 TaxID=3077585 RepID=UPI0028ED5473|nr:ribonuclease E activity regulator RraA [Bacillus sp. DTU_2020_1000418_1_SI_GHA_SEK_038]WNS76329.1 ribonuclease E activity regulator RraA [Bacillus sp. DTU_2020_1000418_1_SI_GHA_SEK_038]
MIKKTADLCDKFGKELEVCQQEFRSFGKKKQFDGPISTVRVFEDNVLVKQSLETIPEGNVLVVDGGGSKRCALVGDMLAEIAVSRKLGGVIINGCVRDSAELAQMDIGLLALGTNPLRSKKDGKGEKDIIVTFGGIDWNPGDYIYADEDGVVISSKKLI